jgi:serine/threonine-protein kinase RsbW
MILNDSSMTTSNEAHNKKGTDNARSRAEIVEQCSFVKRIDSLEAIFSFIDRFSTKADIDSDTRYVLQLAVEELFTNMVKYSTESDHNILIALSRTAQTVRVSLTDFNVRPFDPTEIKDVDVSLPLEQRKPGGLGLFLTKKLIETIHYQYENGNNVITLTKSLE